MLNKHLVKICSMILIVCIIFTLTGCGSAISSSPSSSPAVNNSSPAETSKTEKKATYTLRLGHEGAGDDHPYNYGALNLLNWLKRKPTVMLRLKSMVMLVLEPRRKWLKWSSKVHLIL